MIAFNSTIPHVAGYSLRDDVAPRHGAATAGTIFGRHCLPRIHSTCGANIPRSTGSVAAHRGSYGLLRGPDIEHVLFPAVEDNVLRTVKLRGIPCLRHTLRAIMEETLNFGPYNE